MTPLEDRLDSWKEIAAYLGRGIRTVQRWEREEGLPVHRLVHEKRGSIYARREEIAAWWESRRQTLTEPPVDSPAPMTSRLERVTMTSAMTTWPALSSDARLVAYVSDGGHDGTTPQIWIQQIGGASLRLTSGDDAYSHLSFSPDNTSVVFTGTSESAENVYEVPALGGESRLLQRDARGGTISADGRWLASVPRDGNGIRIADRRGGGFRRIASELVDVACAIWAPDSHAVLVHARPGPALEPDWRVVPIDGSPLINTGIVQLFQKAGLFTIPMGAAWLGHSLIVSAARGPQGVCLYRQRVAPSTFQPTGEPEQLSAGSESAFLPSAARDRVAFLSNRADANLWSVAVDPGTGVARGPLQRLTRGPHPLGFLTATSDFRTLAYFSFRLGRGEIFLRDLRTGSERALTEVPAGENGYPAISPDGSVLAYGMRLLGGERAQRPIFLAALRDGTVRTLGEDCGGRPREWIDERRLIIERFARLNSIAWIDTDTGDQHDVLISAERSIRNPRLSPDRRWIAFDASRPGETAAVFVSPFADEPAPESAWRLVERSASHPFWSADGRWLYFTPTGTNPLFRSAIRGRPFDPAAGLGSDSPIAVCSLNELVMPAYLAGTTPLATPDQIILVLGDFRGDIWLLDLGAS